LVIWWKRRGRLQNPYKILSYIGLTMGHVFLDVGCGKGFLTLPAATVVGPEGLMYAVDKSREYLEVVRQLVMKHGLENVRVVETPAEELNRIIPKDSVDRAVMIFSFHHMGSRAQALRSIRKALKPDGTLYILEPIASRFLGHGTNPDKILHELVEAGLSLKVQERACFFGACWHAPAKRRNTSPANCFSKSTLAA